MNDIVKQAYLDILFKGREVWNKWRKENRHIKINFPQVDFSQKDFSGYDLSWINFQGANFEGANLAEADLGVCSLNISNLSGAYLYKASLVDASFTGANLSNAELSGAELSKVIFRGASMAGANLEGATLFETYFVDVDLSEVKGLKGCQHAGPCTLDHRTLMRSGHLHESFLRGCGLPNTMIDSLASLPDKSVQFHSCFISFTEADDDLAQRLYLDLQESGIRCWRWKEDAKWGQSLISEIDQAVLLHDKLIVICSKLSSQSKPVIREIERALQREDLLFRQGKEDEVLFPIRVDDYIFEKWSHPRKADVLEKNIGDFRGWKEHGRYRASLERLRHGLKLE